MEASRQQLESLRATHGARRPFLEEFIPLRNSISDGTNQTEANSASGDKANWMTTAQLWSQGNNNNNSNNNNSGHDDLDNNNNNNSETEIGFHVSSPSNNKLPPNGAGGGFLQFSRSPVLALASPDSQELGEEDQKNNLDIANLGRCLNRNAITVEHGKAAGGGSATVSQSSQDSRTAAAHRKARRCWSPDLHRRFVNALQMLGGSQVATPKQIRELMKVDGLTNDEVKSHLQKYRLHTRRPSPSPQATVASTPQLVVLGGIWVPQEYSTGATTRGDPQAPATLYGAAHPTSQHFSMGHEFFAAPPPPHHHLPFHQQQFHLYKTPSSLSRTQHSRESDARRTGDQSESIEIGKSESGSWRADSGVENGGERKGRALKEDGEVSNGRSDITLKF